MSLSRWHAFNKAWEVLFCEFKQWSLDITIFLLTFPFLEERLECGLKVECHCSETGAFEVEVEIHVVLLLLRICHVNISYCLGLSLDVNRHFWLLFSRLLLSSLLLCSLSLLLAFLFLFFKLQFFYWHLLRRLFNFLA